MDNLQLQLEELFDLQCNEWDLCAQNYKALQKILTRKITCDGSDYTIQFNPSRIKSATAAVQAGVVERPCFLCSSHRPRQQRYISYKDNVTDHEYELLVNPYPIVNRHFTIVSSIHQKQTFDGHKDDMIRLAHLLPDYLLFFNGACSGASAPDHMHFQAVPKSSVPLLSWDMEKQVRMGVTLECPSILNSDFKNILCWTHVNEFGERELRWLIVNRKCHRPWQYDSVNYDDKCLISPASLEFAGLVPLSREEDYKKMTGELLLDIFSQVCSHEHFLRVGIIDAPEITYETKGKISKVSYIGENLMSVDGKDTGEIWEMNSPFILHNVTIGKEFHWEQQENQTFGGILRITAVDGLLHAINYIQIEEYLKSVISSEMSANNNLELLKTHAIISRSWVLRQIAAHKTAVTNPISSPSNPSSVYDDQGVKRIVYWFDQEDHTLYDVCADDHCQRYQGISRATSPEVARAIEETRGEVLVDERGEICDARFSKCCGGVSESFDVCWQDISYHYLLPIIDAEKGTVLEFQLDREDDARKWIENPPIHPFCNTQDEKILKQVLNNYDYTTHDFYRWEVKYTQSELSSLIEKKMHLGLGDILKLTPLKRGKSGRIYELLVEGSEGSVILGKELVIRKALSESHLYSSAFVVDEYKTSSLNSSDNSETITFVLKGAGWGHGVGLCQIGAACMSMKDYDYRSILKHYFQGAKITRK